MNKRNNLLVLLFLIIFLLYFQSNGIICKNYKSFHSNFQVFGDFINNNFQSEKELILINSGLYEMEIYNISLLREGNVEIGETIQIMGMYTLNYSPFKYVALENWMDIGDYPEDFHTIPTFVNNFTYSRNITLDPSRFDVNKTYYGKVMLKLLDIETSFVYSKQNTSNQEIFITESKVNYTITQQWPEIILSPKKTNISFNFFNINNNNFKFSDSNVNFLLYAPNNSIIQNETLLTTSNGDVNILLKTNSCKSGGNYTLKINTQGTEFYKPTNYTIKFSVYNDSTIFNVSISENEKYVSISYDLVSLELSAYLKFDSDIFWNSSFSSGVFVRKDNFTYKSNLTVPYFKNSYVIDIWANLFGTNSTLNRKINLTVVTRPINFSISIKKILFSNKIKITAKIFDNLTNHPIINDEIFNFYVFSNSNWIFIGNSKGINGEVSLTRNLPNKNSEGRLLFKIEIFNSSIYSNLSSYKEIILTELSVLSIPEIKIFDFFPILFKLQTSNGTDLSNENIQIFINGFRILNFKTKPNVVNLLIFLAPAYETVLNFLIIYEGSDMNLNSYFVFKLNVKSDVIIKTLGNFGFFISIIISSIFTFLYLKNRKSKNLSKLKVQGNN